LIGEQVEMVAPGLQKAAGNWEVNVLISVIVAELTESQAGVSVYAVVQAWWQLVPGVAIAIGETLVEVGGAKPFCKVNKVW